MDRKAGVVVGLVGGLSLLLSGCFDVEQSLVLKKDLSGTAGFRMAVNFEPMVLMMMRMQRQMAGKEGEPTAAEIAQAKEEFLASKKSEAQPSPETAKAELEKSLPPGVKLLDSGFKDEGLKLQMHFAFGFDNVSKLQQIKLSSDKKEGKAEGKEDGAPPKPGGKNPFDTPFGDLQITDEGKTLLLTTKATDPMAEQTQQMGGEMTPEMKKQMEDAFQGLRVAWKIETPFEVLESNATRREGKTLIWEYDLKTFEKMTPQQRAEGIRLRLKK
jgi:hypothetical protein